MTAIEKTAGTVTRLEKDIAIWIEADFLLVSCLQELMFTRIDRALQGVIYHLSTFKVRASPFDVATNMKGWCVEPTFLKPFLAELEKSTICAYKSTAARGLQARFTACVLAMRHHMPESTLQNMMAADSTFKEDIASFLMRVHFKQAGVDSWQGRVPVAPEDGFMQQCSDCSGRFSRFLMATLNPWGDEVWCQSCGRDGIFHSLGAVSMMISETLPSPQSTSHESS